VLAHRIPLFRKTPGALLLFRRMRIYCILGKARSYPPSERKGFEAVPKRKAARFSATKAVKANARERVGQPKPVKVVDDAPRTGRKTKHKPKLQEIIEHGE